MKKVWIIIGLVVVLAGIVAGFILLQNGPAAPADTTSGQSEVIHLVLLKNSDVKSIEYTFDGETVKLIREGDDFLADGDPDFQLDVQKVLYMLIYACNVDASSEVSTEGMEDMSSFGFEGGPLSVKLTLQDGSEVTEEYGILNQYTGTYYFRTSQKDGVYMVDDTLLNFFSYHMNELAKLPEDWSDFNLYTTLQFAVTSADSSFEFVSYSGGNPNYYDNSTNNYFWFVGYPYLSERACSTSPVQNLLKLILDLVPDVGVDYNPTAEELADYNLTDPRAVIHVYYYVEPEDTGETTDTADEQPATYYEYTLSIGRTIGSYTCVMLKVDLIDPATGGRQSYSNDGIVYGILTETLQPILNYEVSTALAKDLCKLTAETVTRVVATRCDGTAVTIDIDGENVTEKQQEFFETLNAIEADDRTFVDPDGTEPFLTIEFYTNRDNFSRMVMTLTEYGTQYYRADFAGVNELLINKRDVETLDRIISGLAE